MESEVKSVAEATDTAKAEISAVVAEQKPRDEEVRREYSFKTALGKSVAAGEIKDIDEILNKNLKILEPGIVDYLLPGLQTDFLYVGQSKGKFGGGKRRIIRNTQKVTAKAKRQHFSAMAVVGDGNGHIGLGKGRGLESVVAKEKAIKTAKMNIIKIKRGCGSWECACGGFHSIPFKVTGKCGSVIVTLIPGPRGIGFSAADDVKTLLKLAGIKDVWSRIEGQTSTRINLGYAAFAALKNLNSYRIQEEEKKELGVKE